MKTKEIKIQITESCILCQKCAKSCPSRILIEGTPIRVKNPNQCLVCGHCVAVCPTSSVEHSYFPSEKVHRVDKANLPKAEQIKELIRSRRSRRAFTDQAIPEDFLREIVEAAYRAPTASNLQEVSFVLITDPKKLKALSDFTMGVFSNILKKVDNAIMRPIIIRLMPTMKRYLPSFKEMMQRYAQGDDMVLRKATALLLIYTPVKSRFGSEDANLAYQNASLMAESLDVAQFYTGFVLSASKMQKGKLEKILGIEGRIQAGMAMGIPAFSYPNYIDKKEIKLKRL